MYFWTLLNLLIKINVATIFVKKINAIYCTNATLRAITVICHCPTPPESIQMVCFFLSWTIVTPFESAFFWISNILYHFTNVCSWVHLFYFFFLSRQQQSAHCIVTLANNFGKTLHDNKLSGFFSLFYKKKEVNTAAYIFTWSVKCLYLQMRMYMM